MNKNDIIDSVQKVVFPLKQADSSTEAKKDFLFTAQRTNAGRSLPPYYLVYFLLVDLLGYKNLGQFEKVAWSVPVDYKGRAFLIEHRKFGLGIFAHDLSSDEDAAAEIATRINEAVRIAQPYFDYLADQAADSSRLNVVNKAVELYDRHRYYLDHYENKRREAEKRKGECVTEKYGTGTVTTFPAIMLKREAKWLALSAIETFFSWTEHVFIHVAILQGALKTGRDVKRLSNKNWYEKFKAALDLSDPETQRYFDELTLVRQQLRNFDAHGSFGKNREAFWFHSPVGAVPLRLPYQRSGGEFKFGQGVDFVEHDAIELIQSFAQHLWSGPRAPAEIYIQKGGLPLILTQAADGTYAQAMASEKAMNEFVKFQADLHDRYANMDF